MVRESNTEVAKIRLGAVVKEVGCNLSNFRIVAGNLVVKFDCLRFATNLISVFGEWGLNL